MASLVPRFPPSSPPFYGCQLLWWVVFPSRKQPPSTKDENQFSNVLFAFKALISLTLLLLKKKPCSAPTVSLNFGTSSPKSHSLLFTHFLVIYLHRPLPEDNKFKSLNWVFYSRRGSASDLSSVRLCVNLNADILIMHITHCSPTTTPGEWRCLVSWLASFIGTEYCFQANKSAASLA